MEQLRQSLLSEIQHWIPATITTLLQQAKAITHLMGEILWEESVLEDIVMGKSLQTRLVF